jgi:predicted esterase
MDERRKIQTSVGELTFGIRLKEDDMHPPVILLHGWTGDERSMWVLSSAFPSKGLIVAPRGIVDTPGGQGYGWANPEKAGEGSWRDFKFSVIAVSELADQLGREFSLDRPEFVLMGFSQGAALAFAVARAGFRPAGVVALAAYLPKGDFNALEGLPIYWGHGTRDETVPVAQARQDREELIQAGAEISYCEADVGHKVGVECMREVDRWFLEHILNKPIG